MTQYANLKDYFQNEHIKVIQEAISNHLKNDRQITEPIVRSLVCTDDDTEYNAEFEIGVSVKVTGTEKNTTHSYIVTVRGNLEQRFKDIQVKGVRSITSDMFPEDNILSQFILPDITEELEEHIGSNIYNFFTKNGIFDGYMINVDYLVKTRMLFVSPLNDNCLGRIILADSDVEIIYYEQTKQEKVLRKETIHAKPGTILLNYKKYAEEYDGRLRITIAHELIHLRYHSRFLKVLQLLGKESVDMHSSTDSITLGENMIDVQKALCIAERQADILAMRVAIPKSTVPTVIREIVCDTYSYYENQGDRMQAYVIKFAEKYGVSCYVAKERLRQLGYDCVDGTIIEFDDNKKKPFTFPLGTLKENETFVIDRNNYEQLLRDNSDFADLINSGRYVYLGYVVCLFDSKYINVKGKGESIELILSEYAREQAEKCLLKFLFRKEKASDPSYYYNGESYLNDMPKYNEIVPQSFDLCEDDTELNSATTSQIEAYNENMNQLNSPKLSTFANTVVYHMLKKGIDPNELHNRIELSTTAIKKINTGETENVNKKNVMALCIGLELDSEECYDMFKKAGYNVREDTLMNRAYRFLFSCTNSGLQECNKILRYFNQDELPYHKGQ